MLKLPTSVVLEHLSRGHYASQIAKAENASNPLVTRKIKQLERQGRIKYQEATFPKKYTVLVGHEQEPKPRAVRGHAYKFKFKLLSPPEKPIKQEIKLKNTSQYLEKFGNALIRFTSKHVIVELRDVRTSGKDAGQQNIVKATARAIKILNFFKLRNHFEFDIEPEINIGYHLAIENDQVIKKLEKEGIRVQGKGYHMDDSDSTGGELEFVGDPFKVDNYLQAGEKIAVIEKKIDDLTKGSMTQLQQQHSTKELMLRLAATSEQTSKAVNLILNLLAKKI